MKVFIRHHASSLIDTFKSVAAAFFGVQSNKTRKRDFSQGRLSHFVVVGIISVIMFVVILLTIVSIIIPS
ncbi:DUF2970 domain-containing protein [Colwelliaceae bacterium MEBiC 14330]